LPKASLLILGGALALMALMAAAQIATAHSRPVRFDPAPGAVLNSAPTEVSGWFTSDVRRDEHSFIRVLDAGGARVDAGAVALSSDRRQMSVGLSSGLGEGRYLVHWSTFDDEDGEVFEGCYTFFVGQAAAESAVANGDALDGGADCPVGGQPDGHAHASAASLEISVPERVSGNSVSVTMNPTNFTPRAPDGSTMDPAFGHYHIYLDKIPLDVLTGMSEHSHDENGHASETTTHEDMKSAADGGLVENPVMTFQNSYTFSNLKPGVHTITVVLNYDNHQPLQPPVIASRTFTVEGEDGGGAPLWTLAAAGLVGLAAGSVAMKLVERRQ
jgi:methionine-rich copper-binding protein CopC